MEEDDTVDDDLFELERSNYLIVDRRNNTETRQAVPIDKSANADNFIFAQEVKTVEAPVEAEAAPYMAQSIESEIDTHRKCTCITSRWFPHRVHKCALGNASNATIVAVGAITTVAAVACVAVGAVIAAEAGGSSKKKGRR